MGIDVKNDIKQVLEKLHSNDYNTIKMNDISDIDIKNLLELRSHLEQYLISNECINQSGELNAKGLFIDNLLGKTIAMILKNKT